MKVKGQGVGNFFALKKKQNNQKKAIGNFTFLHYFRLSAFLFYWKIRLFVLIFSLLYHPLHPLFDLYLVIILVSFFILFIIERETGGRWTLPIARKKVKLVTFFCFFVRISVRILCVFSRRWRKYFYLYFCWYRYQYILSLSLSRFCSFSDNNTITWGRFYSFHSDTLPWKIFSPYRQTFMIYFLHMIYTFTNKI